MSNFNCAKCGAVWLDQSWLGYKTGCAHTMEEAMTTTATPRTDKFYDEVSDRESHDDGTNPNWSEPSKWSYEAILDLVDFARTLEAELAQVTEAKNYHNNERIRIKQLAEEAETNPKWAFLEWRKRAEEAEAKNAALLAALEEIKGRVQFGVSTHMSSDIVKLCDAALKEGK